MSYPLHPAQQDVFLDQLMHPESPRYNIGGFIKLRGKINKAHFIQAVNALPLIFDAFRMRFDLECGPVVFFDENFDRFEIGEIDFSTQQNPEAAAMDWMARQFDVPFEIKRENVLSEQYLLTISPTEYWRFIKYHHLIIDGVGFSIENKYIADYYRTLVSGKAAAFEYPPYKIEMFKAANYYGSDAYRAEGDRWKKKIGDVKGNLVHGMAGAGVSEIGRKRSSTRVIDIDKDMLASLEAVCQIANIRVLHISMAALIVYFKAVTGRQKFLLGTSVHRRGGKAKQTLGMFAGDIPFLGEFDGEKLVYDFLQGIANSLREDYRNKNYLLGDLIRHFKSDKSAGPWPWPGTRWRPAAASSWRAWGAFSAAVRGPDSSSRRPWPACPRV